MELGARAEIGKEDEWLSTHESNARRAEALDVIADALFELMVRAEARAEVRHPVSRGIRR